MSDIDLFTPGKVGAIPVANRVVMGPLTRARAGMDGVPSPFAPEYYRQRATAGLIITEATTISQQGRGYAYTPGIYNDAQETAWRPVVNEVHAAGGRIVLQLWHVGRMSHVSLQENGQAPVAPSAIQAGDAVFTLEGMLRPSMPRALRTDEIPGLIADYENAARRAKNAGFDGVEVHMANGYLLDQWLRDGTNTRDDQYGGSTENRLRLPLEVTRAVEAIWGGDRVGVRISPASTFTGDIPIDSDPMDTYGRLIEGFNIMGLAYLHAVEGQTMTVNGKQKLDFHALRRAFRGAYIANNGYDRELAQRTLANGEADMIAFARPYIGNPDLVERLRRDAPLFEAPQDAYYGGGAKGYTDFKTLEAAA